MLPLRGHKEDRREEVEMLFDRYGIADIASRYPNEVSLGQRQRAAIIRAFALKPRYLLLDEVTSALDVEASALLLEDLRRLRQCGVGIVLATHLLHFARSSADMILFLDGGRVAESGPATILDRPTSRRLEQFVSLIRGVS